MGAVLSPDQIDHQVPEPGQHPHHGHRGHRTHCCQLHPAVVLKGTFDPVPAALILGALTGHRHGLAELSHQLLHLILGKDKSVTISDWEAPVLSRIQLDYAADDALVSFLIFKALRERPDPLDADQRSLNAARLNILSDLEWVEEMERRRRSFNFSSLPGMSGEQQETPTDPAAAAAALSESSRNDVKSKKKIKKEVQVSAEDSWRTAASKRQCAVLSMEGKHLFSCDQAKATWYVEKKKLAKAISVVEAPPSGNSSSTRVNTSPPPISPPPPPPATTTLRAEDDSASGGGSVDPMANSSNNTTPTSVVGPVVSSRRVIYTAIQLVFQPKVKTKICMNWQLGQCSLAHCPFAHGVSELAGGVGSASTATSATGVDDVNDGEKDDEGNDQAGDSSDSIDEGGEEGEEVEGNLRSSTTARATTPFNGKGKNSRKQQTPAATSPTIDVEAYCVICRSMGNLIPFRVVPQYVVARVPRQLLEWLLTCRGIDADFTVPICCQCIPRLRVTYEVEHKRFLRRIGISTAEPSQLPPKSTSPPLSPQPAEALGSTEAAATRATTGMDNDCRDPDVKSPALRLPPRPKENYCKLLNLGDCFYLIRASKQLLTPDFVASVPAYRQDEMKKLIASRVAYVFPGVVEETNFETITPTVLEELSVLSSKQLYDIFVSQRVAEIVLFCAADGEEVARAMLLDLVQSWRVLFRDHFGQ